MYKTTVAALVAVFFMLATAGVSAQALLPQEQQQQAQPEKKSGWFARQREELKQGFGGVRSAGRETLDTARGRRWFTPYAVDADGMMYLTRGDEHWQCSPGAVLRQRDQEVQIDNSAFADGGACKLGAEAHAEATTAANTMSPELKAAVVDILQGNEFVVVDGERYLREREFSYWQCQALTPAVGGGQRFMVASSVFSDGTCTQVVLPPQPR